MRVRRESRPLGPLAPLVFMVGVATLVAGVPPWADVTAGVAATSQMGATYVTVDLSDRTRAALRSAADGVALAKVELTARLDGAKPARLVAIWAYVRDGAIQGTQRSEVPDARPGGAVQVGVPYIVEPLLKWRVSASSFRTSDTSLAASTYFVAKNGTIRDWTPESIQAATPRGVDTRRADALYVAVVPTVRDAGAHVRPLVVVEPR